MNEQKWSIPGMTVGEKAVRVYFCPLQIPHWLALDWTRTFAVNRRRQTARAMARSIVVC